jgi:hypothetical protein
MTERLPPPDELDALVGGLDLGDLLRLAELVGEVLVARAGEAEARDVLALSVQPPGGLH